MTLHHRAILTGWSHSRTLGRMVETSIYDVGYPWGTDWRDSERVKRLMDDMDKRGLVVTVETRDAG